MKLQMLAMLVLSGGAAICRAADFEPPVRLKAGGAPIRVESPGYAFPCLADLDRKGKADLFVGQFHQGKIQVFKNLGGGKFGKGAWLQAEGKVAEATSIVPGARVAVVSEDCALAVERASHAGFGRPFQVRKLRSSST